MSCRHRIRTRTFRSYLSDRLTWVRRVALALMACWTSSALTAAGAVREFDFDIPEGPLAATLLRIAEISGTIVSFRPGLVEKYAAPSVRGRLTLEQALATSVASSGLVVEITASGTATVSEPTLAAAKTPAAALPAADGLQAAPAVVLPRVEILGTRAADGLRGLRSWSATRSDTPLGELSQAVSVLTPEALALQGGSSMLDSAAFVSGAGTVLVASGGVENFGLTGIAVPTITVRGLAAPYALSGQRSVTAALPPDNVFVERVEVPKGPSGVLDAIADFKGRGGMVNLVLKEAQPYEHATVGGAAGSQDGGTVRLWADLGDALSQDAAWRMVGYASRSGRTAGGFDHNSGGGLLGTLRWRRDRFDTAVTVQAERQRFSPLPDARGGRAFVDGLPVDLPPERVASPPGEPADRLLSTSGFVRTSSRWSLTPQWNISLATLMETARTDSLRHQPFTPTDNRVGQGLSTAGQLGLAGEIKHHRNIKHRLLLGLDAGAWRTVTDGVDLLDGLGLLNVDIRERKYAVLLQDEVSTGPLRLRASVQHARTPQRDEIRRRIDSGELQSVRNYLPVSANNWDAGMLVQITPGLAAYAGTQKTTEANLVLPGDEFAQDSPDIPDGVPLPPTTTRQVQAGLRVMAGPRLTFTAEAFRLRQDNLKLLNTFSLVIPGRASTGLELELIGRPRPNLDISLGFTYMRCSEAPEGGGGPAFECAQVPRRSMHMLSRIRLGERFAPFSHLGLAWHAASSTRIGQPYFAPAALTLPGGGTLDLQVGGDIGPLSVTASIKNVFDQRLFGASADPRYIPLLPGRALGLTVLYTP